MARCARCNKFMLFKTASGYCNDCSLAIVREKELEEQQKKLEEEKHRKAEIERIQQEERRLKEEAERRQIENERLKKEEAERRRLFEEAERKRREEEDRLKREEDKRRIEEEKQKREAAELLRRQEEHNKELEESRRKQAEMEKQLQNERKRREEAEKKLEESKLQKQEAEKTKQKNTPIIDTANELEKLTKDAIQESSLLLKQSFDLLKSAYPLCCKDFEVSYRISEREINNFTQFKKHIILYFAEYVSGVLSTIGAPKNECASIVEQLVGEDMSTDIDYRSVNALDLKEHTIPWVEDLFAYIDALMIHDSRINVDSMMFVQLFIKIVVSLSGRLQQTHMSFVTSESNKIINEYNHCLIEFFVNQTEELTGKRPEVTTTSAKVSTENNQVTNVTIEKEKEVQSEKKASSKTKEKTTIKKTDRITEIDTSTTSVTTTTKQEVQMPQRKKIVVVNDDRVPNEDQRKVINELDRNVILFASAGTGKTFTVAKRVSNILISEKALPEEILCLTFTIKAANEMKDDVLHYVGDAGKDVIVRTIHSFCYQVMKEESKRNPSVYCEPTVCDDADEAEELKNALLFLGLPEYSSIFHNGSALNNFMSALKHTRELQNYYTDDEESDFQRAYEYIRSNDREQYNKITIFYDPVSRREMSDSGFMSLMSTGTGRFAKKYNDLLRQSNLVDFDDLICQVHQLMRNKECREYWQKRYKYIIIDEMQDTSELEYDTIKQMVGNNNIMMCGDYFQTIYEWRGSNPDNVLNSFIKEFKAERYMFAQNYRSTRTLTQATFGYLKNTYPSLVGKFCPSEIITKAPEAGEKILNVRVSRTEDEARWVFDYLEKNPPKDPTRICIMARSNPYISNIYKEFVRLNNARRSGLRFFTVDNDSKFFRKAVIKDIMAFINILLNRTDLVNMARITKKYVEGIGQATIESINQSGEYGVALTSFLDRGLYESDDPYAPLINAFSQSNVVIYDTETTGLDLSKDQIIQISAIKLDHEGNIIATFDRMVIPTIEISKGAQATHHQTIESIIANGGTELKPVMEQFREFVKGSVLVGHNSIRFDSPLVKRQLLDCGLPQLDIIAEYDTMIIAKQFLPTLKNYKLHTLCSHYRYVNENAHNALGDITATGKVLTTLLKQSIIPTTKQRKQLLKKYMAKFEPLYCFVNSLSSMLDRNQVPELVEKIIKDYELDAIYSEANDLIAMDDLRHAISASSYESGEAYLREFVSDAALSGSQMDLLIQKLHKIPIITVHQSKGCEFDLVILVGADDDNFPTYLAKKNGTEGEEKRVFYVAITRAKKKLIMTSISTKVNRGGTWPVSQSRYIANIPNQFIDSIRG